MPTYVYKFVDTGETIEVQQAFTDDALTEAAHPRDGTMRPVRKVFTPVGITFKGNGFYKTDNRAKSSSGSSSSSPSADWGSKSESGWGSGSGWGGAESSGSGAESSSGSGGSSSGKNGAT